MYASLLDLYGTIDEPEIKTPGRSELVTLHRVLDTNQSNVALSVRTFCDELMQADRYSFSVALKILACKHLAAHITGVDKISAISQQLKSGMHAYQAEIVDSILGLAVWARNQCVRELATSLGALPVGASLMRGESNHVLRIETDPAIVMVKLPVAVKPDVELLVDYYDRQTDRRIANFMTWTPAKDGTATVLVDIFLARFRRATKCSKSTPYPDNRLG